jgi:hypothetical protein
MASVAQNIAASLHFNGAVKFGELLTSASVLVAAGTLYVSLRNARLQRRRDLADAVRTAAAEALAKLDRYARLPKAVAESAQTLVVETSRKLAKRSRKLAKHISPGDVGEARDYLYAGLMAEWQEARATQRAEGIELAHVKLFGHRPDAYRGVAESIIELDSGALSAFDELLDAVQDAVGRYEGKDRTHYQPAELGNELRDCLGQYEGALDENARQALKFVSTRLQAIIGATDKQVIDRTWQTEPSDQREVE